LSAIVDAHNFVIIHPTLAKPLKIVSDATHFVVEKGVDGGGRLGLLSPSRDRTRMK
jgi:hypothetical protein